MRLVDVQRRIGEGPFQEYAQRLKSFLSEGPRPKEGAAGVVVLASRNAAFQHTLYEAAVGAVGGAG